MQRYKNIGTTLKTPFIRAALIFVAGAFLLSAHMAASFANTSSIASYNYASIDDMEAEPVLLAAALQSGLETGETQQQTFSDAPAMRRFYQELDNKPFWLEKDPENIKAVLRVLENSWTHGLNPQQYNVNEMWKLLDHPIQSEQARFELLLSDAIVRYGRDMTGMRVAPDEIKQEAKYWRDPLLGIDILQTVKESANPAKTLEELAPKGRLYNKLRQELIQLAEKKPAYDDTQPLSFSDRSLRPGDRHNNVPALRARLGLTHNPEIGSPLYYDDPLAQAVMAFQKKHGLEADGIVGRKTLSLLNMAREDKINQIIANLERLRWVEQDKPDRYILVNIPSAMLWAVDNDEVKIEMPVVVGMHYRQTKSFKTEITGIRFNPTWTVPLRLKMEDFLPRLREDPSYLTDRKIELFEGYGKERQTLDPQAIDWHNIGWREMGKMRMVQTPGDHNALGRIRVLMENPYDIYMHDTNHKEYFDRAERNLSSGCIRLSRPEDVAHFILEHNEGWSGKEMKTLFQDGKTTDIEASATMPVYILYLTTWLDNSGELIFGRDAYKQDKILIEKLARNNELYSL